ncbi:hypothetical protein EDC01DRAFT_73919 [Geopyxis carbonaria]|nr:hypothetical protein EDC01DRAFT_73919 [Geopyxis carbonaria]
MPVARHGTMDSSTTLSEEDIAKYVPIIDAIFAESDLSTISVKKVRTGLSAKTGADFSALKKRIDSIITSRFDIALGAQPDDDAATPESTGPDESASTTAAGSMSPAMTCGSASPANPRKRKSSAAVDDDARVAAALHAQLNGGRPSRGGRVSRSAKPVKKVGAKKKMKKSKATVDSDLSGDDAAAKAKPKRKLNPNNAFMRPLILSQELATFIGESQMPRPEVVKQIWAYVKKHDLQDPADKRYILCDDVMKPVFGDKVHMFTMNKVLSTMMWKPDEVSQPPEVVAKLEPQEA